MSGGVVCKVCNTENTPDAMYCQNCKTRLQMPDTLKLPGQSGSPAQYSRLYPGQLEAGTLVLSFLGRRDPLLVPIDDDIILGRAGPNDPETLVDLNPLRAGLLGVSRQHAVIRPHEQGYTIEDLDSTNGTWVNNTPLPPGPPRILNSGDQIQLGELILIIAFEKNAQV